MHRCCSWLLLVGVAAALLPAFWSATAPHDGVRAEQAQTTRVRLLVPAYFYPAGAGLKEWERLFVAGARVPIVAIVNPASGPGPAVDPNYQKVFTLARAARAARGVTLLGYVSTSYGKRPRAAVQADVDQWRRLYPDIQGIFFDEQASGAEQVGYMADLYAFVRSKHQLKLVVSNPGTVCVEGYLARPATDVACLFEGPRCFDPAALPAWVKKYPASRTAILSYQIPQPAAMKQCLELAAARGVGYCYVTDATGTNPWSRLPAYWDTEVAVAAALK